jgi:hypothetical protein
MTSENVADLKKEIARVCVTKGDNFDAFFPKIEI